MAALRSWISGSPYIHDSAAAAHIAATARGEGPNTLSLAPMRARKGRLRMRSWASGPRKGTVAGNPSISGVKRGLGLDMMAPDSTPSRALSDDRPGIRRRRHARLLRLQGLGRHLPGGLRRLPADFCAKP